MPPAFEPSEYKARVGRTRALVRERRLDALLCTTPAGVCYLTGYESVAVEKFWLAVVPAEAGRHTGGHDPLLMVEDFESHNARVSSFVPPAAMFPVGGDPIQAAAHLLREVGLSRGRLGVELGRMSTLAAADYLLLASLLPEAELIDATDVLDLVRGVKSPAEIEYLRRAGRISAAAMNAALAAAREGGSDNEMAAAGYAALHAGGSEYMTYPWFVTVGERSGVPHTTFLRTALRPGDPLFLEVGACVARYSAPMMRAGVIGRPSDLLRRMAGACAASVEAMIAGIRPGRTGDDVAREATAAMGDLPLGSGGLGLVWHGYFGYSVGLGFPPTWADAFHVMIALGSQTVLEPGMVFHANTSLRDIGKCGAAVSETILVTETGCEVLTEGCPRALAVR